MAMLFAHRLKSNEVATLVSSGLRILVVVATQDKLVNPKAQRAAASQLQATCLEVEAAHMLATHTRDIAAAVTAMVTGRAAGADSRQQNDL